MTEDGREFFSYEPTTVVHDERHGNGALQLLSYTPSSAESKLLSTFSVSLSSALLLFKHLRCTKCGNDLKTIKHTQTGLNTNFYFTCKKACTKSFLWESLGGKFIEFKKLKLKLREEEFGNFLYAWDSGITVQQYYDSRETTLNEKNCYHLASFLSSETLSLSL